MPKKTLQRVLDTRRQAAASGSGLVYVGTTPGGGGGVTDHGLLTGLGDDDHPLYALKATAVTAGAGLTGTGTLAAALTLAVGAGDGITVGADSVALASSSAGAGLTYTSGVLAVGAGNGLTVAADAIALTTPGTLTVDTTNAAAGSHTHAITTASDASLAGSPNAILRAVSGGLTLEGLTTVAWVRTPLLAYPGGDMTIWPAGDLILDPASNIITVAASNTLKTANYASQVTGWAVDYAGAADFRYIFVDEMHAKKFVADLEQALAGGQIIAKSVGMLGATFTAPAAGAGATLTMRDLPSAPNMAIFEAGDIVLVRNFSRAAGSLSISNCWGVVTGYTNLADNLQSWTFTRSAAPNAGAMTAGTTVAVDSIVLDYGVDGNGTHEVNAIDGLYGINSPYSQVVTWEDHPETGQTVRTRLGNLRGLFSVANEYGLYAGSGVTDADSFIRLSSYTNRLNNLPMEWWSGGAKYLEITAASGVAITNSATFSSLRSYGFKNASGWLGGLFATTNQVTLQSTSTGNQQPLVRVEAIGNATYPGQVSLYALGTGPTAPTITLNPGDTGAVQIHGTAIFLLDETSIESFTVTNAALFSAGSASAPGLAFSGETNTGFYTTGGNIRATIAGTIRSSLSASGLVVTGALDVTGGITSNGTTTSLGDGLGTETALLLLGYNRQGDGASAIYFTTDNDTYLDYGLRILRNATAAGSTNINHRGTGQMLINLNEAADFQLNTSAVKRLSILSDGLVGIGNITPTSKLDVDGNVRGLGLFADGEGGGVAGTTGLSNGTSTVSTGTGTVKLAGTTARNSDLWLKFYVGTTPYYVPAWSNIS